ncbi:cytochrome c biogenesis CcdA family protein [Mameliella sediminis]|uniref:cytochrome c biogenesis CcdA family protein n=1 Tax=Mameliella sediminis TaxID=2836866 RepID=UPI001C4451D2|nr:cytochrome c biogenesis protein CcdA [Mameliella sediminis]MBY6113034.1 sulfite exporter TauE/SafE family protein [Antarctobacter heliothermus]MBY6143618.1 sulfite exporter TauE/SafE family protein [Mameliella alba]MBV7394316.1 sulfite exporter TauE/SafE family protein [Mameliella sediminis]MBY6162272.1 sulfite exporter TauE/SafE family protein [Mameliella alba]MBY6170746.1 sulfite exporter TauE/SafE family protein [Mameliella alba]
MELVFAYGAGLLTLINPCVVPVLPIVIATALQANRAGPVVMAAGLSLSFVVLGVGVTAFGHLLGIGVDTVAKAGAVLMVLFGLALLLPRAAGVLETATAGLAARADARMDDVDRSGLRGQFLGGLLLGAVWSPCIGPTLGGAISLASQGQSLGWATLIMLFFALGVSTLILGLAYGTRGAVGRYNSQLRALALRARPILGATFVAVGLALFFNAHHYIEAWLIGVLPAWLIDLSVSI